MHKCTHCKMCRPLKRGKDKSLKWTSCADVCTRPVPMLNGWYFFSDNWELPSVFLAILDLLIVNSELVAEDPNWSEQYKKAGTWVNQRCVEFERCLCSLCVKMWSCGTKRCTCPTAGSLQDVTPQVADFTHVFCLHNENTKYLLDQSASSHS